MKAKDIKLWQLFYNRNGYLCLAYYINGTNVQVVNYNGSFYSINRDSDYEYPDEVPEETVKQFFKNFPMHKISSWKDEPRFESILKRYKNSLLPSKLLLLC